VRFGGNDSDDLVFETDPDPAGVRMFSQKPVVETAPPTEPVAIPAECDPGDQNEIKLFRLPGWRPLCRSPHAEGAGNEFLPTRSASPLQLVPRHYRKVKLFADRKQPEDIRFGQHRSENPHPTGANPFGNIFKGRTDFFGRQFLFRCGQAADPLQNLVPEPLLFGGNHSKIFATRMADRTTKRTRSTGPKKRSRPDNHVGMKPGNGWHKRNFLAEVLIPSLFTKRAGESLKPVFPKLVDDQICITWIGHASFLIQTAEHSVLIDPNWAKWLKVIKRIKKPGIEIHDLPAIDLVLVTHAHFDHLDRKTLRMVASHQPIAVPHDVGNLVHDLGFQKVHEMNQWDTIDFNGLQVTMTPAFHWGARVLHDQHRGFGGFYLQYKGRSVFHCGDTAYFPGLKEIGKRLDIEIALLPIGAYDTPSKRDVHMNPEQAIQAFQELHAKRLIPMHFGTFRLSYEPVEHPPSRLMVSAIRHGLADDVSVLTEGVPEVF